MRFYLHCSRTACGLRPAPDLGHRGTVSASASPWTFLTTRTDVVDHEEHDGESIASPSISSHSLADLTCDYPSYSPFHFIFQQPLYQSPSLISKKRVLFMFRAHFPTSNRRSTQFIEFIAPSRLFSNGNEPKKCIYRIFSLGDLSSHSFFCFLFSYFNSNSNLEIQSELFQFPLRNYISVARRLNKHWFVVFAQF